MRARKRLAALLIAGALSAPMLAPAPASAQLGSLGPLSGGLLGLDLTGLLGTAGGTGGLTSALEGVLGGGLLNDVLRDSSLLNQCGLALGLLDPATCLTASTLPTTTGLSPFGFGGLNPFGNFGSAFPQSFGVPQVIPVPIRTADDDDDPIVVTNNNSSSSSSSAAAAAAPGGGASATATGNTNSNQSQTIVIP